MLSSYVNFLNRFRWPLAVIFLVLFALSLLEARHLKLKSDFKEMLPANFQSVKDLDRILQRVGGVGGIIIAIESDNQQAAIRFAKDLVAKLQAYPPEYVRQIDYNVADAKNFFADNKFLYMKPEDIQEVHDRLDRRIQQEKLKASGLLLNFLSPEEVEQEFSTKDIEDKYKGKTAQYEQYTDGYFFGENGRLLAIILKPPGFSTGVDFSRKLVAKLQATIDSLHPTQYDPSIKIGLTGKYMRVLFEYQTLLDDVTSTAILVVTLVSLVVFLYYRRIRMVALMAWAVFNGVAWTFAFTAWQIGYLTTQTAFLGSIIVGNGINYGLIFMARYLEERKLGKDPLEAMRIAVPATFAGTLASSLTTSVAFGALIITQVRGFSHFGIIGGIGMFACWVASYSVLPVFLSISESIWPTVKESSRERFQFSLMKPFSERLPHWAKGLTVGGTVFSILCIPMLLYFIPRSLEYDFTKLRVKTSGKQVSEESAWNNRVKTIFPNSLTPAVVLTDRAEDATLLCDEINHRNQLDAPEKRVIDSCKSLHSYLPEDQEKKLPILASIRQLLEGNALKFLNEKQKAEVEKFKSQFTGKALTVQDLPQTVVRNFQERDGEVGKIVYVYPNDKAPLWNGRNLMHFADIIRFNKLPSGDVVTGSGDSVIFSDLLRAVIHDGPKATLFSFLAVCLVVALIFRNRKAILFIIGTLMVGVLWMGGMIALLNIKINFFNFIAIPTTFGIGVDYGVNIYQRYKLEGKGSIPKVLRTTGGAVVLCSLTTIIGYFTLIIARNQALVSFGWIAIIGEITCLTAALLFIPALATLIENKSLLSVFPFAKYFSGSSLSSKSPVSLPHYQEREIKEQN